MDKLRFQEACEMVVHSKVTRDGIGTLQERTLHAVLKHYFEPDADKHEVRIGSYVADIFAEGRVIEIQTGSFQAIRNKLKTFLCDYPVTVVYPMAEVKWLTWLDEETGELTPRRKSPKKGTVYGAFRELYKIKSYLKNPNLTICIVMLDIDEYRLLNGWSHDRKRGSSRYERIPLELKQQVMLEEPRDYLQLVPTELSMHFTSLDYGKKAGLTRAHAQTALNVLYYLGAVDRIGKTGNAFTYEAFNG